MLGIRLLRRNYLELVFFKAYCGLKSEAARTYFSFLWWILEPLLSMIVYYVIFGLLFPRNSDDFVAFLLIGLVTWQWFANSIRHGMNAILANGHLTTQVYLPKEIFPAIEIVMDLIKFGFVFVLLIIFLWSCGLSPNLAYLALPCVLLLEFMLLLGFANTVASFVPFFPDLRLIIDVLLNLAFFLSGVFFSIDSIPTQYRSYFYLNPMANLIEAYRTILMDGAWPDWYALIKVGLFSLVVFYISQMIIKYYDRFYPKIV